MGVGWTQIAETAGAFFLADGFGAVSLRKISAALQIQAASLYYHCPGGKAELYERSIVEVMGQMRGQLERTIGDKPFKDALRATALALLESPPVDFRRIQEVDLPALEAAGGSPSTVIGAIHAGVHAPLRNLIEHGKKSGDVRIDTDPDIAAAAFLALVLGLGAAHGNAASQLVTPTIDLLLHGIARA